MSGATMYRMPRLVEWEKEALPLPGCMYRMRNLHDAPEAPTEERRPPNVNGSESALPDMLAQVVRVLQRPSKDIEMLESRQIRLLEQLETLQKQMQAMRTKFLSENHTSQKTTTEKKYTQLQNDLPNDIVINVSPSHPPYSLLHLQKLLRLKINCHVHSSITELTPFARELNDRLINANIDDSNFKLTLIWKNVGAYSELIVSTVPFIMCGEVIFLKYLVSALNCSLSYSANESFWKIDSLLDTCHKLQITKDTKEKKQILTSLSSALGKEKWINGGSNMSIVDVAAWSILKQINLQKELTGQMKSWLQNCEKMLNN